MKSPETQHTEINLQYLQRDWMYKTELFGKEKYFPIIDAYNLILNDEGDCEKIYLQLHADLSVEDEDGFRDNLVVAENYDNLVKQLKRIRLKLVTYIPIDTNKEIEEITYAG